MTTLSSGLGLARVARDLCRVDNIFDTSCGDSFFFCIIVTDMLRFLPEYLSRVTIWTLLLLECVLYETFFCSKN